MLVLVTFIVIKYKSFKVIIDRVYHIVLLVLQKDVKLRVLQAHQESISLQVDCTNSYDMATENKLYAMMVSLWIPLGRTQCLLLAIWGNYREFPNAKVRYEL